MTAKAAHLKTYVRYLVILAFLCAALEVAFALSFRSGMFLHLDTLNRLDSSFLIIYLVNIALFVAVGFGLRRMQEWVHGTMIIMSAVGSVILLTLFLAGIFLGGFVQGMDYLLSAMLQPLSIQQVNVELLFILLPVILFFNPYNLYLFSRDSTMKSLFLPPQKDAPALKRREL